MTAVGNTYFEKPSRDKNINDCQQTGVKFDRTFLKFATVDSNSDNSPEIKDMLKKFQTEEVTEASLYGDFKRIITFVKFVPCIMDCVLLFYEKTLFCLIPTQFFLCLLSSSNRVKAYPGQISHEFNTLNKSKVNLASSLVRTNSLRGSEEQSLSES